MDASTELQHGSSAATIARQIRSDIEAGRFVHGTQLPSTRQLATQWSTSVATISRAMQQLVDEGLVITNDRSSRIVNCPEPTTRPGQQATPTVLLIGGYAGSGKTELGRIIARLTGSALLDKDSATRSVVEAALSELGLSPHDRESDTYLRVIRPGEYEALRMLAAENITCGNSVIVTAPFARELSDEAWCDRISAEVESLGGQVRAIWIRCDPESMHTYVNRRGAARDTFKLAHWNDYISGLDLELIPRFSPDHVHVVDNSTSAEPLQRQAEKLLTKWALV